MADNDLALELARSVELLHRLDDVVELAATAMGQAVPRAMGFAHVFGEGAETIESIAWTEEGSRIDVERVRLAFAASTPAFDRSCVSQAQRERWFEPPVADPQFAAQPVQREAERLGVLRFGRLLVCDGATPIACIGAGLHRADKGFEPREREALVRTARTMSAALRVSAMLGQQPRRCASDLTPRESLLLTHLRDGHRNRAIAAAMGVKPSTIKTMLERLYERFGARNRVHLCALVQARAARAP